jgi:hypothetical protein
MLKDIRDLTGDPDAYAEELRRRWTGLLSYRYIGRSHGSMNEGPVDNTVKLRRDLRNASGGLMAAPIAISAPEGGGVSDLEAVPNPVIHACQILDPGHDVERIEVLSEVLKRGSRMAYSRSRIVDASNHARVLALTEGQGAMIGVPPGGLQKMPEDKMEIVDSPDLPPLWQAFGAARRPDGIWTLPVLSADKASPDAALHIGPQHVVLEAAAMDLAAEAAGSDRLQVRSWHVMFLSRGKAGPFHVKGEAFAGTRGQVGVRLTLHDDGASGDAITAASALFEVLG